MREKSLKITTITNQNNITAYEIELNGQVYVFSKQNVELATRVVSQEPSEMIDPRSWTTDLFEDNCLTGTDHEA